MYLITMHVPIYVSGDRHFVTSEWKRVLVLLRESLKDHFHEMTLLAPSLPADTSTDQLLEPISAEHDGIRPVPAFDLGCRARQYWLKERRGWIAEARSWIARSRVVHAGLDDVYRPIMYDAFNEAVRQGKPTVFVQDTDIAGRSLDLARGAPLSKKPRHYLYAHAFHRGVISGVRRASLSMLKGTDLMRIYGPYARNPKEIQDTSYLSHEIVPADVVQRRFASLESGRPLRLVYCGRLVSRKGVDYSLEIIAGARRQGLDVAFDVIGGGEELKALQQLVERLGLGDHVAFLGAVPYGPDLLRRLATYDARCSSRHRSRTRRG